MSTAAVYRQYGSYQLELHLPISNAREAALTAKTDCKSNRMAYTKFIMDVSHEGHWL